MAESPAPSVYIVGNSSSPDPLNDSLTEQRSFISSSPSKKRTSQTANIRQRRISVRSQGASTSPPKSHITAPISPSKTITEQTLSPWKIRVTVEAEPEGKDATEMMRTYTKTTTIPLRGESSPAQSIEPVHSERGRKSSILTKHRATSRSTSKSRQRSGTPKPGRRQRQSVTDLDIVVLGDDADEDEWGKPAQKKSPRKSAKKTGGSALKTGNRSRGISSFVDTFEINEDIAIEQEQPDNGMLHTESPELRQIDLNTVSVRPRANSSRQKASTKSDIEKAIPSTEVDDVLLSTDQSKYRKVSVNSMRSYPTPSPTPSDPDPVVPPQPPVVYEEGYDTVMESEGFTMIDLDSIPSVRHLRSSPMDNAQIQDKNQKTQDISGREPRPSQSTTTNISPQKPPMPTPGKAFPSYLLLAEGESDISSALPSSPPLPTSQIKASINRLQVPSSASHPKQRQVTPQTYQSPQLPSPPRITPSHRRDRSDSAQAMKAGIRLQSALKPQATNAKLTLTKEQPANTTRTEIQRQGTEKDALFEGFDSGLQRELRAGLRFGEELAKHPEPSSNMKVSEMPPPIPHVQPQVWRASHVQQHTSWQGPFNAQKGFVLQSNYKTELETSGLSNITNPRNTSSRQIQDVSFKNDPLGLIDRSHAHHELPTIEQRSEQTHQAVPDGGPVVYPDIVQIHPESSDHNVEINDITMEDADEDDVWLAEAKVSSSSPREVYHSKVFKTTEQRYQRDNATNFNGLPRRTLKSSQQKREDQVENEGNNATMLTNTEGESSVSGLLWRPNQDREHDVRFGAGQIKQTKRELRQSGASALNERNGSGTFDVSKMLATPKRVRESLEERQKETIPTTDEEAFGADEPSSQIDDSTLPTPPQTIPVNFNDSSSAILNTSPYKARRSLSPSAQRPPTPRSAIKGARQSSGGDVITSSTENLDAASRKVIWAKRSNHMDEDWIESSRSMISEEGMHDLHTTISSPEAESTNLREEAPFIPSRDGPSDTAPQTSSWVERLKAINQTRSERSDGVDGVDQSLSELSVTETSQFTQQRNDISHSWQPTSRQSTTSDRTATRKSASSSSKFTGNKIPSYLQHPSYPSDPKRSTSKPLLTSGQFTNTHFRTLHIIYAKSSRPRFHAPQIEECRPEIRRLVTEKWRMDIDEEHAGLGSFNFKIGETMGRVLERFCREIEWDYLSARHEAGDLDTLDLLGSNGIWGGQGHSQCEVKWGWTCVMLAEWLGRIVVGEVVRNEEFGGKDHQR